MKRALRSLLTALVLAAGFPAAAADFDRSAWIADFKQLKAAITANSPNLEWAAERGLDLVALEARARARLDAAEDDAAARSALERFVRNFGDGHMELRWPTTPPVAPTAAPPSPRPSAPRPLCAELGYRDDDPDVTAVATRLPGYQPLTGPAAPVAAGVAPIGARTAGVVRIPLFAPAAAHCTAALAALGRAPDAPCDEACRESVRNRADRMFLADVAGRISALAARRPDVMLVDVAGNGGGNDSAIAIARMLGGREAPTPSMGLIRNAATVKDLEEDEALLRAALEKASAAEAAFLRPLIAAHAAARIEAARPCDLSPLWRGERVGCSQLVRGPFFAGGLVARDLPPAFAETPWAEYVSSVARFGPQPELWRGPVVVLVDGNSASSTELFGAMLQDTGRVTIAGAPSFGAGCGWVRPREDVVLSRSGGILTLPNCARFRKDGSNELDGLQPDVLVGFRTYDSPQQRAARLRARAPAALEDAVRRRGR